MKFSILCNRGKLNGADVAILVPRSRGFLPQAAIKQAADRLVGLQNGVNSERLVHLQAFSEDGCAVYALHEASLSAFFCYHYHYKHYSVLKIVNVIAVLISNKEIRFDQWIKLIEAYLRWWHGWDWNVVVCVFLGGLSEAAAGLLCCLCLYRFC